MKSEHKFAPLGGLNSDDDNSILPAQDYLFAKDMEIGFSVGSRQGVAASLAGTSIVGEVFTVAGTVFKTLGGCNHHEENAVLQFFASTSGQLLNGIRIVYKEGTSTILYVGPTSELNLGSERIVHANVIDGMLMWSQPGRHPKKVNLDKLRRFYESGGTDPLGYPTIDAQTVNAGAHPPVIAPTHEYVTVDNYFSNFVNADLFQFAYYYIYDDNEISRLSHFSTVAAPIQAWTGLGLARDASEFNNAISVGYNTGHYKVKRIGLCFRNSQNGPWRVFTTVDKKLSNLPDNTNTSSLFFGNESNQSLPLTGNRNFDFVPLEAKAQEFLPNNELVYANFEAGMDVEGPDVVMEAIAREGISGKMWAINFLDDQELVNTRVAGFSVSNFPIPKKSYADMWFDSVPVLGSVIKIKIRPATQTIPVPSGSGNFVQHPIYTGGPGPVTMIANTQTEPGFNGIIPLFELLYEIQPSDVAGGPSVLVENIAVACNAVWEDFRDQFSAGFFANANGQFRGLEAFSSSLVLHGAYASPVGAAYTAPILTENDGYATISDISSSHYVRFVGCHFDYGGYTAMATGISTAVGKNQRFGYFRHDLRKQISPLPSDIAIPSLKCGTYHRFGLNHYDGLKRDSSVQTGNAFDVYVPFFYEEPPVTTQSLFAWAARATINHRPPIDATHYSWVWLGSKNILSFGHYAVSAIAVDPPATTERVKITLQQYPKDPVKNKASIRHSITEGDVLRPVMKSTAALTNIYFDQPLELVVLSREEAVGPNGEIAIYVPWFDAAAYGLVANSVVEIYTVKKIAEDEETQFFEVGPVLPILNAGRNNRAYGGNIQNQEWETSALVQPAIVFLAVDDVWVRERVFANGNTVYVEDFHFSDYFQSKFNEYGRTAVVVEDSGRKRYQNQLIHSGKYFAGTNINDLFSIAATSAVQVQVEFGAINYIGVIGFALNVLQSYKLTSIYIGRTVATNADGDSNVLELLDRTFGTIDPSAQIYGCQHPSSVAKTKRHIYFFDAYNGMWVRKATNGPYPISKYKMQMYWAEKGRQVIAAGADVSVLSVYDERHEVLICTVKAESAEASAIQDTVLFSEKDNRWKIHSALAPQGYESIGDSTYCFDAANAYELFKGQPNTLLGEYSQPEIHFVVNADQDFEKVFDSMAVQSTGKWSVEIEVEADYSSSKRDMRTRIMSRNFERNESAFHANIRGDMNTPGYGSEVLALIDGDNMRGKNCVVKMKYEGMNPIFILTSVIVSSTLSLNTP